jgi:L-ascorbate metabolism protein UlaG (beta-lactamase superfamily)
VGDRLTFLGHSTVLVDIDGVRVLTDPLLGHLALAIRRQVPAVPPETLVDLSAVFISHGHLDHLDLEPCWASRRSSSRSVLGAS